MELAIVIAGIFLLYLLQVALYRLYWDRGLSVQFFFQREPVREGEGVCLYERLTNRKRLPLPVLYIMFDMSRNGRAFSEQEKKSRLKRTWFFSEILSLRANEEKERRIEIRGLKRGLYRIPELRLTTSNLFLTDRFSVAEVRGTGSEASSLYVYPRALPEEELSPLFQLLSNTYLTDRYSYEDDFEIRGIREYQSFDPMKRVNWKASARLGELQVNMMEYAASQKIMLVLVFHDLAEEPEPSVGRSRDSGQAGIVGQAEIAGQEKAEEQRLEYAVSLTAGLAEYCLEQGIPVGLLSNGEDFQTEAPLSIEACGGRAGREGLLQGLSRLCIPRHLTDIGKLLEQELIQEEVSGGKTYVILDTAGGASAELTELCQEYGTHNICWEISYPTENIR